MTNGYSGTPLVRKLGIKNGMRVLVDAPPRPYREMVADLPSELELLGHAAAPVDLVHVFTTVRADLSRKLPVFRTVLKPAGAIWVSWPKKAAHVPTDITEDVVRELALAVGLVDVKVCSVDETWSGLKLVIRLQDRL